VAISLQVVSFLQVYECSTDLLWSIDRVVVLLF